VRSYDSAKCDHSAALGPERHGDRAALAGVAPGSASDRAPDARRTRYRERFGQPIALASAEAILAAWH